MCLPIFRLPPISRMHSSDAQPAFALWSQIQDQARAAADAEPLLAPMLESTILNQPDLGSAAAERIGGKLEGHGLDADALRDVLRRAFTSPGIADALRCDLCAIVKRDPAADNALTRVPARVRTL